MMESMEECDQRCGTCHTTTAWVDLRETEIQGERFYDKVNQLKRKKEVKTER